MTSEAPDPISRIHESDDPAAAFVATVDALARCVPVRAAGWRGAGLTGSWPEGDALAERLIAEDGEAVAGEDAVVGFPLPVPQGQLRLLLGGGAGAPAGGVLEGPVRAFGRVLERYAGRRRLEQERDELRVRVEESEALHVLGLAANRTLDPDEVVTLVARTARTLLGAHYVMVVTADAGRIRTAAAVGVRGEAEDEEPFAARVIQEGKPLTVHAESEPGSVAAFPFHEREGMRTGIGVPLSLFGQTFGALVVGYRRRYSLQPRDTRLAFTLAGHAAVAISNARLHHALEDRSRELEQAYQELRWSAEAKERFFATMSHELRTPLNAIIGYQSLLLDEVAGRLPPAAYTYLGSANRAAQSLLLLVNDILDLSKLEAGKMELLIRPTEIGEVVDEALSTVRPQAQAKGLRIERVFPARLSPVATDADRVRQILVNLLSNAVKFTDRGGVSVALGEIDPPGAVSGPLRPQWLEIRVTDSGPGIPPEDHERIFHEFEQVIGSNSRGGTGLGLPISRKLARLLGGDLTLESAPGAGATFILRLPPDASGTGTQVASRSGT